MRFRWVTAMVIVGVLTGCTPPVDEPVERSRDDHAEVAPPGDFAVAGEPGTYAFATPFGPRCTMTPIRIWCVGTMPDAIAGTWRFEVAENEGRGTMTAVGASDTQVPAKPLAPWHEIVLDGGRAICTAVHPSAVACRLGDHGFSLEAPWTIGLH